MGKIISSAAAISLIRDNDVIGIGGFGGFSAPDEILRELAKSFFTHGRPKGLHVVSGISPGDLTENGYGLSIIKAVSYTHLDVYKRQVLPLPGR